MLIASRPRPGLEVGGDILDHSEIAARGKGLARARQDDARNLWIPVDVVPDVGELLVCAGIERVELTRLLERYSQNALSRAVELQPVIRVVTISHA